MKNAFAKSDDIWRICFAKYVILPLAICLIPLQFVFANEITLDENLYTSKSQHINEAVKIAHQGPTLKKEVIAKGDLITIGDLFDHAENHKNIAVFQSPDIGTDGVISVGRVEQAVRGHGLIWENTANVEKILVRRPSRVITLEQIKNIIRKEVAQKSGVTSPEALEIFFTPGAKPIHLDVSNKAPVVLIRASYNPQDGAFRASIGTEEANGNIERGSYQGQVIESAKIVVPSQPIERGHILTEDDVKIIMVPVARIQANFLKDKDLVIGKSAVRQLAANQPLRKEDVQIPKIVKTNEPVDIRFRIPGLSLKAEGRAMEDGAKGQVIKVTNIQSKRVIEAVVIEPGVVSVSELQNNAVVTGSVRSSGIIKQASADAIQDRASEEAMGTQSPQAGQGQTTEKTQTENKHVSQ